MLFFLQCWDGRDMDDPWVRNPFLLDETNRDTLNHTVYTHIIHTRKPPQHPTANYNRAI